MARKLSHGAAVLFYHGVEEEIVDARVQGIHLPLHQFSEQIAWLRKYFDIVRLDELFAALADGTGLDGSQVAITFDDGYKNNLSIVEPYLGGLNVPFTVFVSTRHVDEGLRFPTYYLRTAVLYCQARSARILGRSYDMATESSRTAALAELLRRMKKLPLAEVDAMIRDLVALLSKEQWAELNAQFGSDSPMTWSEVAQLHSNGVAIESHCHDHIILHDLQNTEEVATQLRISKDLIDRHVGECRFLAYPNGTKSDISGVARDSVQQAGYRAGLTTVGGEVRYGTDAMLIPRIGTAAHDIDHFAFILNSRYRQYGDYKRWARTLV